MLSDCGSGTSCLYLECISSFDKLAIWGTERIAYFVLVTQIYANAMPGSGAMPAASQRGLGMGSELHARWERGECWGAFRRKGLRENAEEPREKHVQTRSKKGGLGAVQSS